MRFPRKGAENLTSMLRLQIIPINFKKLNKFFKRYIIINHDFRNIKTIELSIEKYSQISVYMTRRCIPSCGAAALPHLWESSSAVSSKKCKAANL